MLKVIPKEDGGDLIRIHKVITRGLKVAQENAKRFQQAGFPDDIALTGFIMYLNGLLITLHGHHLTEEEVFFPYLQGKRLVLPFQELIAEHKVLVSTLNEVQSLTRKFESGDLSSNTILKLQDALLEIENFWPFHISKEEKPFLSGEAKKYLSPENMLELGSLSSQHAQQHGDPPFVTIPFLIFNLSREDRTEMTRDFPPVITEELVPVVWKDQWAPMKPFLLD